MKGYIYIRTNEWCEMKNVYKVGITNSIKDRNNTYITGEIIRGKFVKIFELDIKENQLKFIDNIIKLKFKKLNVYIDAGTEFYDKIIIDKIDKFLIKNNINFKLVNENDLNRKNNINKFIENIINKNKIIPKPHQKDIIDIIDIFYSNNNIGNIIWTCGLGKSLLSIFIIQKLNFKKIIIGVPSCFLQHQFAKEILEIFPNKENILINPSNINEFLSKKTIEPLFIITTYHSSHLFLNNDYIFDFKIADECHHLVGKDDNNPDKKRFLLFHKINSIKSLFMTATKKTLINNDDISYSMEDEKIFGKNIDEKTFKWAIDNKYITDYRILIIENQLNELMEIKHKISSSISNKNYLYVYI